MKSFNRAISDTKTSSIALTLSKKQYKTPPTTSPMLVKRTSSSPMTANWLPTPTKKVISTSDTPSNQTDFPTSPTGTRC